MKRDRLRWLTARPIAHRGFHDISRGLPENSLAAFEAAAAAHYAIECDLHPSADGVPVVFHDLSLERLTGDPRSVRDVTVAELGNLRLAGTSEWIPTLDELLALGDRGRGRLPLMRWGRTPFGGGLRRAGSDARGASGRRRAVRS